MTPSAKRQAIAQMVSAHRLSVVRACQVVRLTRAAWYRPPRPVEERDADVIEALSDAAARFDEGVDHLEDSALIRGR